MYLPSGIVLFLVIAAPWHFLVAGRNPGWAHFYFVHEHWERYTDPSHGRVLPLWIFVPIVLVGLFPLDGVPLGRLPRRAAGRMGAPPGACRHLVLRRLGGIHLCLLQRVQVQADPLHPSGLSADGGPHRALARRNACLRRFARADARAAQGVRLPVRPHRRRPVRRRPSARPHPRLGPGGRAQALRLHPCGHPVRRGHPSPRAARGRGPVARPGRRGRDDGDPGLSLGILALASPVIDLRSTKDLAVAALTLVRPGDRVYHYHAFFHDFTYYSGRTVGLVSYTDELELQFLGPRERKERFHRRRGVPPRVGGRGPRGRGREDQGCRAPVCGHGVP